MTGPLYLTPDPTLWPVGGHVVDYATGCTSAEGRDVVLVVDPADPPGGQLVEHLRSAALSVELVGPAIGRTLADHAGAGLGLDELAPLASTPKVAPELGHAQVIRLSDVRPEKVRWLWPGRIPLGKLTVLDGRPKVGKSTLALDLAARVSTGRPMPDGAELDQPSAVVLLSAEDGLADTIAPRLIAAGADLARVVTIASVPLRGQDGAVVGSRPPVLPDDLDELEAVVRAEGAALVVIDVLMAYLSAGVKSYSDQDVRRALMPLAKMAERTGAAVLVLRHPRKGGGSALDAGGGSVGIVGAARSVLVAAVDPEDETEARRVLAVAGGNLAAPVTALGFALATDEGSHVARISWTGATHHRPDQLTFAAAADEDTADTHDAASILRSILDDGPRPVTECFELMAAAGFSKDQAKRAKAKVRARSVRVGGAAADGHWCWTVELRERMTGGEGCLGSLAGC